MKILIVTGIYPPDIGGPATHADDVRRALGERGHDVTVLSLTDEQRTELSPELVRFPRGWPWPLRTVAAFTWLATRGRQYDVVYATGLDLIAVSGGRVAGRPVALKVVGDPAWERGQRRGLTDASFDDFQDDGGGPLTLRMMRGVRDWTTRNATALLSPSPHLAASAQRWARRNDARVIPNGVRGLDRTAAQTTTAGGLRVVFVGRLVAVKRLDLILQAIARSDGVHLVVVGDGPQEPEWRALARDLGIGERVSFLGALSHDETLGQIADADALVLASDHEGLPHVVLEALTCSTPVVTGENPALDDVLTNDVNALVVERTPAALAEAFDRLDGDRGLLERLREGARESGRTWSIEHCVDQLESLFVQLADPLPRAVFFGKAEMESPPTRDDEEKYTINARHIDAYVVCIGTPAGIRRPAGARALALPRMRAGALETATFYGVGPFVALGAAVRRPPAVIVCQSPFEAFGVQLLRSVVPRSRRPRLQIEVHGDWRTATRLYGSTRRRLLGPAADRVAEWTLRRADRIRVVSDYLADLVRQAGYDGPMDQFIAYSDYDEFLTVATTPPPDVPRALFVGMLERYKAVDVLLDAWELVVKDLPEARLTMIGGGTLRDDLRARIAASAALAGSVELLAPMSRPEVRRHVDDSTCLVLPSRSEGLGRVVLEAMGRERPVVASAVGGIVELVDSGATGLLVPPEDPGALADALVAVLSDLEHARTLGREAGRRARSRDPLVEYELGMARLAEWVAAS
jgi:glycosyltransferase involved in cell wall biosynthesis